MDGQFRGYPRTGIANQNMQVLAIIQYFESNAAYEHFNMDHSYRLALVLAFRLLSGNRVSFMAQMRRHCHLLTLFGDRSYHAAARDPFQYGSRSYQRCFVPNLMDLLLWPRSSSRSLTAASLLDVLDKICVVQHGILSPSYQSPETSTFPKSIRRLWKVYIATHLVFNPFLAGSADYLAWCKN